jgi:hypothetical protein
MKLFQLLAILALTSLPGWSQPSNQTQITLSSERSHYFLGENALIHFCVKNVGTQPVKLDVGGDYRGAYRSLRFKLEAFDAQNNPVPDPHPNAACFGGLGYQPTLKSGESFYSTLALAHYRRIPKAGHYRISVTHDLGWTTHPKAWLELDFVEPNATQATEVVQAMSSLPKDHGYSMGQRRSQFRDYWTMSYPIYLEPLIRLQNAKPSEEAIRGIGQIATPEATLALLEFAARPNQRPLAADELCRRLPISGDKVSPQFGLEERTLLAQTSWNDQLKQKAREVAIDLLQGTNADVSSAAKILSETGTDQDLALVAKRLEHFLVPVSSYPRPAGPAYDLETTLMRLTNRAPEGQILPSGSSALLLELLKPNPAPQSVDQGLLDSSARVRELAVLAIKDPKPYQNRLLKLLFDPDPGAQVAACEKLSGDPHLLELVRKSDDEWVLRAACNACKGQRLECSQILAERLVEIEQWHNIYTLLAEQILTRMPGHGSNGDPGQTELNELAHQWKRFLEKNQEHIKSGQTYLELPKELIPSNFTFNN